MSFCLNDESVSPKKYMHNILNLSKLEKHKYLKSDSSQTEYDYIIISNC